MLVIKTHYSINLSFFMNIHISNEKLYGIKLIKDNKKIKFEKFQKTFKLILVFKSLHSKSIFLIC